MITQEESTLRLMPTVAEALGHLLAQAHLIDAVRRGVTDEMELAKTMLSSMEMALELVSGVRGNRGPDYRTTINDLRVHLVGACRRVIDLLEAE